MNKIFESADRYLARSSWKDIAMLKFCLFSMGMFAGSYAVKQEHKKAVRTAAAGVFTVTYIPLMYKYYLVVKDMIEEGRK